MVAGRRGDDDDGLVAHACLQSSVGIQASNAQWFGGRRPPRCRISENRRHDCAHVEAFERLVKTAENITASPSLKACFILSFPCWTLFNF